ncbi:MAG: transcriptional regulator [Bacillota bacterium]|nr:MAG: transcriptional regulator [Bacillota bacterium]
MSVVDEINHFYYRMALHELQMMNGSDAFSGLSYNSLLYLNVIDVTEDCTVTKLADALSITRSAATLKVNDLVRQGAVLREQSQADKRVNYIRLSPEMSRAMRLYDKLFERIEERLKDQYTPQELSLFEEILHEISRYDWRRIQIE